MTDIAYFPRPGQNYPYVVELKVKGTEKPGRVVQNRIVCQKIQHPWGEGGKSLETPPQVVK